MTPMDRVSVARRAAQNPRKPRGYACLFPASEKFYGRGSIWRELTIKWWMWIPLLAYILVCGGGVLYVMVSAIFNGAAQE